MGTITGTNDKQFKLKEVSRANREIVSVSGLIRGLNRTQEYCMTNFALSPLPLELHKKELIERKIFLEINLIELEKGE